MPVPQAQHGAPLETLDFHVYVAGVLVDPFDLDEIKYTIAAASGGLPIIDEDGESVSGIVARRVQEGIFDAGKTVLPPTTPPGDYLITWDVKKLATVAAISRVVSFVLLDDLAVDPEKEGQTRRDIPDEPNVDKLRTLVQDNALDDTKWAFFNSELKAMLESAVTAHTAGARTLASAEPDDIAMACMLAHCDVLTALAKDTARFFRWTDGNESVDKTQTPISLTNTCRAVLAKYNAIMDRRQKEKESGTAGARGRDLMRFNRRRRRR